MSNSGFNYKEEFLNFSMIVILASIGYFATDVYLPSLPAIASFFNSDEAHAQLTIFTYLASFALAPLICGFLTDRWGRKTIIKYGLILAIFSTILCFVSINIYWLIFSRFLQGFFMGSVTIATRSMLPDLYKGKNLAAKTSYLSMSMTIIIAIAPTIGGYIQEGLGWKFVFVFLLICLITILFFTRHLNESLKEKTNKKFVEIFKIYKVLISNKPFILYSMYLVIISLGIFSYITASPFLFQVYIGLSPSEYGLLSLCFGGVIAGTSFINTRLLKYFTQEKIMFFSSFLMIFSGILMMTLHFFGIKTVTSILIPSLIYITSIAFGINNAFAKAINYIHNEFGTASGLMMFLQFFACALGSLIFSIIPESNSLPLSIAFSICGIVVFIILIFALKYQDTQII